MPLLDHMVQEGKNSQFEYRNRSDCPAAAVLGFVEVLLKTGNYFGNGISELRGADTDERRQRVVQGLPDSAHLWGLPNGRSV